jgi:hypothetical protein
MLEEVFLIYLQESVEFTCLSWNVFSKIFCFFALLEEVIVTSSLPIALEFCKV